MQRVMRRSDAKTFFHLLTISLVVVKLQKHAEISGFVNDVPPLDFLHVTQKRIVGYLHPSI